MGVLWKGISGERRAKKATHLGVPVTPAPTPEDDQSSGVGGVFHGSVSVEGRRRESQWVGADSGPLQRVQGKHVDLVDVMWRETMMGVCVPLSLYIVSVIRPVMMHPYKAETEHNRDSTDEAHGGWAVSLYAAISAVDKESLRSRVTAVVAAAQQ